MKLSKQEIIDLAGKVLDGDADEHDIYSLADSIIDYLSDSCSRNIITLK